jgi:hypothetical protein
LNKDIHTEQYRFANVRLLSTKARMTEVILINFVQHFIGHFFDPTWTMPSIRGHL